MTLETTEYDATVLQGEVPAVTARIQPEPDVQRWPMAIGASVIIGVSLALWGVIIVGGGALMRALFG